MSDKPETHPEVARMLARAAAWQAAAASYQAALALERGDQEPNISGGGTRDRGPIELPVGAFRGMTISEAIKLYLQSVRRKQTVREIAEGLRSGGLESSSTDIEPTLRGILHRLKKDGELLRFKDGWDLAEAHSPALRNRLSRETRTPARKSKKEKAKRSTKGSEKPRKEGPKGPSIDQRVQVFLKSKPLDWFSPKQIADAINEPDPRSVNMALARLVRYEKIARHDDGRYAARRD